MAQDSSHPNAIRYDLLVQEALRKVVHKVLADTAKNGLPGEHHFYVTFDTRAPGVKISSRMQQKYPETMNIVLQHVFWDLNVQDDFFEVGLSFGGVGEKLVVPFAAVVGFADPSVNFGLKFEAHAEASGLAAAPEAAPAPLAKRKLSAVSDSASKPGDKASETAPSKRETALAAVKDKPKEAATPKDTGALKEAAKVVSIDAFRKKP